MEEKKTEILDRSNGSGVIKVTELSSLALCDNFHLSCSYVEALLDTLFDLLAKHDENEVPKNFVALVSEGLYRINDMRTIFLELEKRIKPQEVTQ